MHFRWHRQNRDQTGLDHKSNHGSVHKEKKKVLKKKKIKKNQIVYELVVKLIKIKGGKLKYIKSK